MASTYEIGKKLVDLVNQNKTQEAYDTLYSPNIVSIEAGAMPPASPRVDGIAEVKKKAEWWAKNHEVHRMEAAGPWPNGDRFIVRFSIDVTAKAGPMAGKRFAMEEAGLYTVKNSKIVQEEFFYHMGG